MSSGPIGPAPSHHGENGRANGRLSYKFQRLREDIRRAVTQGEYTGRLPGERTLGRRFGANAKTINKALSDLTAEGLLIRQIGRGTFVAEPGSAAPPASAAAAGQSALSVARLTNPFDVMELRRVVFVMRGGAVYRREP